MALQNTLKNFAYDHPASLVIGAFSGVVAAGSGAVSANFIAHADLLLTQISAITITAGTSTVTQTQYYNNGSNSASVHAAVSQYTLIRVTNTTGGIDGTGTVSSLSTSTIAQFVPDRYYSNGTATGQVGASFRLALNTGTGSAGLDGVSVSAGDRIYVVNGTDATHVLNFTLNYRLAPSANVMA